MKDNMNDRQNFHHGREIKPQSKRPYSNPVLQVYGSVKVLTQNNGGTKVDGVHQNHTPSDPSIKENIVKISVHPLRIGLYLFDYRPEFREQWGHGRQFGVMADEVEQIMPEAVSVHPDGYKMVNYAMLGISRNLH
jgi:hypothetical protein